MKSKLIKRPSSLEFNILLFIFSHKIILKFFGKIATHINFVYVKCESFILRFLCFQTSQITIEFEPAILKALKKHFTDSTISGCFFPFQPMFVNKLEMKGLRLIIVPIGIFVSL